jgi:hypothetical protein
MSTVWGISVTVAVSDNQYVMTLTDIFVIFLSSVTIGIQLSWYLYLSGCDIDFIWTKVNISLVNMTCHRKCSYCNNYTLLGITGLSVRTGVGGYIGKVGGQQSSSLKNCRQIFYRHLGTAYPLSQKI